MNVRFAGSLFAAAVLAACASDPYEAGPKASATLAPASGSQVRGTVAFAEAGGMVRVTGQVTGLTPGPHGFHLHEKGDCSSPDAMSSGGHFNPAGMKHGGLASSVRHGGDFGNITADAAGMAKIDLVAHGISVGTAANGVVGRAVVVHAGPDDEKTDPAGNSGARVACGVIGS